MDLNLKIFSWNCQGCASKNSIRVFWEYNTENNPNIVCLVELRVRVGIWVAWKDSVRIQIIRNHPQFISLSVDIFFPNKSFLISFVYGSPDRSKCKILWEGLKAVSPTQPIPWLIMEDFNAIMSPEDKRSPYTVGKRCDLFGNFDLGYSRPSFIWQQGATFVRLDRALANDELMLLFPHCLVHHLTRIKSDHRPFLLNTKPDLGVAKGRPFRFLAGWKQHNTFPTFVKEKWNFSGNMVDSLNNFTSSVRIWNRNKALDHFPSSHLAQKELDVRDELENVLDHEDLLWRQKGRCNWIQLVDRNTNFYHSRMIKRKNINHITTTYR
ncbi:reverse transcriptase [Gossypium australe]|uniref:Reverse transcriptase n=1 Tax=Gossypium australe TaxID=47621 RepID=A0A5B6U0U9_9ROSI|nr:reverse transcriptase [Gossypium australe]